MTEKVTRNNDQTIRILSAIVHGILCICDLHSYNYYWNGMNVEVPTLIHHPRTPTHLFPPEAKYNTSAVHTSVYAFDVYTIGRLLKYHIQDCCDITTESLQKRIQSNTATIEEMMVYDLTRLLLEKDPYRRPDTQQALHHPFFTTTAATTKTTTTATTAATASATATSEIEKLRT